METLVAAKALGLVAFLVTSLGYLSQEDRRLKQAIAFSAGLLSLHYFLLAAWVAGLSLLINFGRNQLALHKSGYGWFLGFGLAQVALGALFFQSPRDLLPIVGSLISGYAVFCQTGQRFRLSMLACTALWLINNALLLSYGAMLQDGLSLAMNLIGILKISRAERTQRSAKPETLFDSPE